MCSYHVFACSPYELLLFQVVRHYSVACIQIYKYIDGKLILKICLGYETFTVSDKTFGLLSDCKSVCFLEFLIYSGCFF